MSSNAALKRAVRKYAECGGTFEFEKLGEREIKAACGTGTKDWPPMVAYYAKSCLLDRWLGLPHELYPASIFRGDTGGDAEEALRLVPEFGVFPVSNPGGHWMVADLDDGRVYAVTFESLVDGELDGIPEMEEFEDLLGYFDFAAGMADQGEPVLNATVEDLRKWPIRDRAGYASGAIHQGNIEALRTAFEAGVNRGTSFDGGKRILEEAVMLLGSQGKDLEPLRFLVFEKQCKLRHPLTDWVESVCRKNMPHYLEMFRILLEGGAFEKIPDDLERLREFWDWWHGDWPFPDL